MRDWPFGRLNWTCKWFPLLFFSNMSLSLLIMSLIGVSRVVAIFNYNLAKKWFTWKRTLIMVIGLWIFSVLFLIPSVFGKWGKTGYEEPIFSCSLIFEKGKVNRLTILLSIGLFLPLLVTAVSYSVFYKKVNKSISKFQGKRCFILD